jgi:hypothetical protein
MASNVEKLLKELEQGTQEAEKLSQEIHESEVPAAGNPEALIKDVAANLAEMSKVTGTPTQSARHFEDQIKLRQKLSEAGE